MPTDHTILLERATPDRLPPTDYQDLARRGQRRRRARRVGGALAGVALLAGVGSALVSLALPSNGVRVTSTPSGEAAAPDVSDSFEVVADLDHDRNTPYAGTASDGRLVVFGGTEGLDGIPAMDGLIVDPATGEHSPIPAPPLGNRPFPWTVLAQDRLLVFGGNNGDPTGAYYDLDAGAWSQVPAAPTGSVAPNVAAWDGQTLIVGDSLRIDSGTYSTLELWRWEVGADTWTKVPPAQVDAGEARFSFLDGRLAVWITPTSEPASDSPSAPEAGDMVEGPATDDSAPPGRSRLAVYDLAADAWTHVPRNQLPKTDRVGLGWHEGDLVTVPLPSFDPTREGPDDVGDPVELAPPLRHDLDTRTTSEFAALPEELQTSHLAVADNPHAPTEPDGLLAASNGPRAAAVLPDGTWTTPVDATTLLQVGGTLLAIDTPWGVVDAELVVRAWRDGAWEPISAERLARSFAAHVATNDAVYVVGGSSMRSPDSGEAPTSRRTEPDEPGPYVIQGWDDIVELRP